MRFLIINGPNLNMLGRRDPAHYGDLTLKQLNRYVAAELKKRGIRPHFFQSNYEGAIISRIHRAPMRYDGILLNAGAYTHYSYAIRDAVESIDIPVMEVHLSQTSQREQFRHFSVLKEVAAGKVEGLKQDSYVIAAQRLVEVIQQRALKEQHDEI